jgi:hypothetical protein
VIPWLITGWEIHDPLPYWLPARIVGVALICVGLIPPVHAFVQFARAGGTPMPIAPTRRLVVSGFNRYVRDSMYVGLLTVILGEALLFGQVILLLYAAVAWAVTAFVHWCTRNPPSPAHLAPNTRSTGVRHPHGVRGCIRGPWARTRRARDDRSERPAWPWATSYRARRKPLSCPPTSSASGCDPNSTPVRTATDDNPHAFSLRPQRESAPT